MTMKTNLKTLSTPWLPLLSGLLLATLSLGACGDDQGACEGASCEPSSGDGDGDGGVYYQPKVGYQMEMIDIFASYKGIAVEGTSISTVGIGAAFKF